MNEERLFDNTICPTPNRKMDDDTKAGGSMHANNDENFKSFIKSQFSNLEENLNILMSTLAFTIKRVESIEQSLNFKVITLIEADAHNLNCDDMVDDIEPGVDSSAFTILKQQKVIDGLRSLN